MDFRWKGAITRHMGISNTWPAKAMRKHNNKQTQTHNGTASGGAPGAPGPWGRGCCYVFASFWPAMCSKSSMA
eukprot:8567312-Heterocapsa_arctica.AAC.1